MKSFRAVLTIGTILLLASCGGGAPKKKSKKVSKPDLIPHFVKGEEDYYQADSIAGHIHTFNAKREIVWEEHPTGKIIQESNNMGFKEDDDYDIEAMKGKKVVLVIGDSHTDGVVYNSESFPNQLEKLMNEDSTNKQVEVINAGVGYYGPQNYLGALKKNLNLNPSTVIVCMYTGNDFLDAIRIESENQRMTVPKRGESYYLNLWKLDEKYPGFTGQFMNQVKFFKTFPEFKDDALLYTKRNIKEIQKLCDANNIELLVTLLPSKYEVEPKTDSARLEDAINIMHYKKELISMNQKMGRDVEKWMKEKEIKSLNLAPPLVESQDTLYWFKDYHLNHKGHAIVAKTIYEYLNEKVAE